MWYYRGHCDFRSMIRAFTRVAKEGTSFKIYATIICKKTSTLTMIPKKNLKI